MIVAEGVDAELHGRTVFGNRKVQLAPVERLAGTPLVVVHAKAIFGDLRLRSLAPGESASRWTALLERLAQRRQLPPTDDGRAAPVPPAAVLTAILRIAPRPGAVPAHAAVEPLRHACAEPPAPLGVTASALSPSSSWRSKGTAE